MESSGAIFETQFGWMGLAGGAGGIQRLYLPVPEKEQASALIRKHFPSLRESVGFFESEIAQIEEYLPGKKGISVFLTFQATVSEVDLRNPSDDSRRSAAMAGSHGKWGTKRRCRGPCERENRWPSSALPPRSGSNDP
jgi:hypothetical protein